LPKIKNLFPENYNQENKKMSNSNNTNTLPDQKVPRNYFPNRRTYPDMLQRYIGGYASIVRADTTRIASVTLEMRIKNLKPHAITAHPDGTMRFDGKDCTKVSEDQIIWSISYFNRDVANGECKNEEDVKWLMIGFLLDATRQMAPHRISTPQNPITPPKTTGLDSLLAKHVLTPIFFPPLLALGSYALVDLSHSKYHTCGVAYNGTIYWRSRSRLQCLRMIPPEASYELWKQGALLDKIDKKIFFSSLNN
jgi:hypothetical protein